MSGSELDAVIRARLDAGRMTVYGGRQVEAPSSLALRAVLDECALAEHNSPIEGIEGTYAVVRTDGLRRLIAKALEVPGD